MVAQLRGEKFVEVTEDLQRENRYYTHYKVGEMVTRFEDVDGAVPHYCAFTDVVEWLKFTGQEDYLETLETEGAKIFERAK